MRELTEKRNAYNCTAIQYQSNTCNEYSDESVSNDQVLTDVQVKEEEDIEKDQTSDERTSDGSDRKVVNEERELNLNDLGEFNLAQRLLDRVNRITIHKVVIDLHPVKTSAVKRHHKTNRQNKLEEIFDPWTFRIALS